MDEEIFFYDEDRDVVCSITTYHQRFLSIEVLVEKYTNAIYFYATLQPS